MVHHWVVHTKLSPPKKESPPPSHQILNLSSRKELPMCWCCAFIIFVFCSVPYGAGW